MSLLEDIFLQDEADEARELERVIEGQDYNDEFMNSDENSEKEDEAEEDKRTVNPAKPKKAHVVKNPRFILNPARLTGPRGIQIIPDHFKDFKFKGKGHEKEDLDLMLKKLEHWAYRLYPKFEFVDCLKKIEMLGKKRPVMVHLKKIRSDQFTSEETVINKESSDEDVPMQQDDEDEFDKLLQQQIDIARDTPAPNTVKEPVSLEKNIKPILTMPKATSSPSISDEQRERMMRNRRLAEERRLSRLNNSKADEENSQIEINHPEPSMNLLSSNNLNSETDNNELKDSKIMESSEDEMSTHHTVEAEIYNSEPSNYLGEIVENIASKNDNRSNLSLDTNSDNGTKLIKSNSNNSSESSDNESNQQKNRENANLDKDKKDISDNKSITVIPADTCFNDQFNNENVDELKGNHENL